MSENKLTLSESGDVNMKVNLSEELVINDDISLGKDEEAQIEANKKSLEDHEKEVNKDLADKVDAVEEINEFEADPVEIHDGEDKKLNIKGLTEKLILEEPSDILNESTDIEDILFEWRDQCVRDVFAELHSYLKHCEYANVGNDYPFNTKQDAIDALESICEEAIYHLDDVIDESGVLTEEVLDEKIPKDLAKAYKNAMYQGRSGGMTDLENATYREVSPEEGYKLYKEDPRQVRLLLGNVLVDFRDDGRPSPEHRDQYVDRAHQFVNRNGKIVRDTMYIPPKYMFTVADKIYVTNEHTPEGQKDRDLLDKRRQNPESPNASRYSLDLKSRGVGNHSWDQNIRGDVSYAQTSRRDYQSRNIEAYKKNIRDYQAYLENPNISNSDREWYTDRINYYKKQIADLENRRADANARLRYANSEKALQKPLERYVELKNNLDSLQNDVSRSEKNLNTVRQNGSPASRENRERLADLQQRLMELRKQIAKVELDLEDTDEEDAQAVAEAERRYEAAMGRLGDAQAEINALLRRN